jgi:arrestin-related trafficking adapter 3/6
MPGDYVYNFEKAIPSQVPETLSVPLGGVKYELEALVERAGAFRPNLLGSREVVLIRCPSIGSLEEVEPIAISRQWEDQLHYDIVISGKAFPMGSKIPIAFKLTPLAKVKCHRITIYVTENIEYYCQNKKVRRTEPQRKVKLFEKRPDSAAMSLCEGSAATLIVGGGLDRESIAQMAGRGDFQNGSDSMMGGLEREYDIGSTEMEFNIQLPSCKQSEPKARLHFDTTNANIIVHHWIKIVLRLSKSDPTPEDPKKRRHFEISIDSPFSILSCKAKQEYRALPSYALADGGGGPPPPSFGRADSCGCENRTGPRSSSLAAPTPPPGIDTNVGSGFGVLSAGLTRPPAAHTHLAHPEPANARPMHLIRQPSHLPPPFEDDVAPPLITPPPAYENSEGGGDQLADYFSRLGREYDDDDDDESSSVRRRERIDVPLTPGGRVHRSMDERRTWLPIGHPGAA